MTEQPTSGRGPEAGRRKDVPASEPRERPEPRRRPRRAVRPGTRAGADESPDVAAGGDDAGPEESERDRWLREQRPPHWE